MSTKAIIRQSRSTEKKFRKSASAEVRSRSTEKAERKPVTIPESQSLEIKSSHETLYENHGYISEFILKCNNEPYGNITPVDMVAFRSEIGKVDYDMLLDLQVCLYRKLIYHDEPERNDDISVDTNIEIMRDQIEIIERYVLPNDTFRWFCVLIEDMLNAGCARDIEDARALILADLCDLVIVRIDHRLDDEPIIFSSTRDYTPEVGFLDSCR